MGRYNDKNLIKYEDTIRLHFDTTGRIAWLTMKNYGLVFHRWPWATPWNEVKELTIGIPAIPGSPLISREERKFVSEIMDSATFKPYEKTITIGGMLDVTDVIKFQVKILEIAGHYSLGKQAWGTHTTESSRKGFTQQALHQMIEDTLIALDSELEQGDLTFVGRAHYFVTISRLKRILANPPGALWIEKALSDYCNVSRSLFKESSGRYDPFLTEKTGFTAYFPFPGFIPQEQRTTITSASKADGKTDREDTRLLKPLRCPSYAQEPNRGNRPIPIFEDFLQALDKDREKLGDKDFFNSDIDGDREVFCKKYFPDGVAYLHKHLEKIDCYAFRGTDMSPDRIFVSDGFLPGVTRTDPGVEKFKMRAKEIDLVLKNTHKKSFKGAYQKALKALDIFTLGVFTLDQDFKGYISTTASIAIAKCFANLYAKEPNLFAPSFCYAVRCRNALNLLTDVPDAKLKFSSEYGEGYRDFNKGTDAKNAMTHFAEQEIAMVGRIGWEDVLGMRVIQPARKGQFFSGPVFLKNVLRSEYQDQLKEEAKERMLPVYLAHPDDGAFDDIFELFSGKSQGKGHGIHWSYDEAPFDCPRVFMTQRELLGVKVSSITG